VAPAKPPPQETIVARLGLSVQISGGFSGEIVEIGKEEVTVALPDGVQRSVAFGERVTIDGKTLPLGPPEVASDPMLQALKQWRRERSKTDQMPAFIIFHDSTLEVIAERRPGTLEELATVPGVGSTKLERYGADLLTVLRASSNETPQDAGGRAAEEVAT
jgi:superfamily II DNA helicase RecQ